MTTHNATPFIRPVIRGDLPALLELRYDALSCNAPHVYTPREVKVLIQDIDFQEIEQMIANESFFTALINDDYAGCAGWLDHHLRHVYIAPAYERQGFASRLVAHTEQDYHTRTGHSVIEAGVAAHACGFYQKNGFTITKQDQAWDGSRYFQMAKTL